MTKYPLEQLLKLWAQEQLTPEQAIGQLLLHLQDLQQQLAELTKKERNPPNQPTPPATPKR